MPRTILLADDSVTIQKVVELTFLDEDFRVVSFANGSDAIARLAELRPDVVLADVHMPGADGYELCSAARATLPGVPVLLLVGTFEVFDPQRAAEVGAAGHIKKPFDSQEMLRRVQELVAGAASEPAAPAAEPLLAPALDELPPIDFGASPAAAAATAGDSWSFEPVSETAPESGEVAADTWGGVTPEGDAAASAVPAGEPVWEPAAEPMAAAPAVMAGDGMPLSDDDVDRIARRVVELIGEKAVRDVAWEVVPDLAELLLKARIRELEASVE